MNIFFKLGNTSNVKLDWRCCVCQITIIITIIITTETIKTTGTIKIIMKE